MEIGIVAEGNEAFISEFEKGVRNLGYRVRKEWIDSQQTKHFLVEYFEI